MKTENEKKFHFFQNSVHDLLQAAKKVAEEWDNYNSAHEFDEYPFEKNFDLVVTDIQNWSDEVGNFELESLPTENTTS